MPQVNTKCLLLALTIFAALLPECTAPNAEPETSPESEPEKSPESEPEPEGTAEPEEGGSEAEAEGGGIVQVCLFVTLYSLIIVIILVGNILVAMTILKSKQLRVNTSNLYLLSLVSARASIAIFVIPARITGMFSEEYLGSILCKLCHFAALGSSAASIFSVVAIAISKYIQVTSEDKMEPMTMKKSAGIIGIIWLLGFAYASRAAVTNDLVIVNTLQSSMWSCTTHPGYAPLNKYFIFVDILCLFLVPLIIIIICYSQVIKTLAVQKKAGGVPKNMESARAPTVHLDKQSMKAIRMLVVLMGLFTICTSSPMALKIYILWGGKYFEGYQIVETVIYMFSYSNSWFNLIVFAYFRDDLRAAFLDLCRHRKSGTIVPVETTYESTKEGAERDRALRMMEF